MYKKSVSAILLCVIAATAIFVTVRAQPSGDGSAVTSATSSNTPAQTSSPVIAEISAPSGTSAALNTPDVESEPDGIVAPASVNKTEKSLKQVFIDKGIDPAREIISIAVDKSDHTLEILVGGQPVKTYPVELGEGGPEDKQISGDHKTPEGTFYITERSVLSPVDYYLGSRWMELSYPNIEDADRGLRDGIISQKTHDSIVSAINRGEMPPQNTALGGGVGIHGGSIASFGSDWTWGCVGLANKDVEDFYSYIRVGTRVVISK